MFTSLDILRLIAWIAYYKNGVILNKTQMQKILYMCYGLSLANNNPLFTDDTPRAWPFGPVFPIAYKRYSASYPKPITEREKERYLKIPMLRTIFDIVARYCRYTSRALSEWSHEVSGPWWNTVYGNSEGVEWNREIDSTVISNYFRGEWHRNL